jgi:hypothetical protein
LPGFSGLFRVQGPSPGKGGKSIPLRKKNTISYEIRIWYEVKYELQAYRQNASPGLLYANRHGTDLSESSIDIAGLDGPPTQTQTHAQSISRTFHQTFQNLKAILPQIAKGYEASGKHSEGLFDLTTGKENHLRRICRSVWIKAFHELRTSHSSPGIFSFEWSKKISRLSAQRQSRKQET